jgi:hypothetical protein
MGLFFVLRRGARAAGMRTRRNSFVIPEVAKRLSGIHNPCRKETDMPGLWIPGSSLRSAPE